MNLTLTFHATSVEDLAAQLSETLNALDPDAAEAANEAQEAKVVNGGKPAKQRKTKAQIVTAVTPKIPETKPAAQAESVFDPAPEQETNITLPDVRGALTEFLKSHTESATQKLLMEHGGVSKLSQLDPAKYKAVYHAATTA